jgi:hypothetical protein
MIHKRRSVAALAVIACAAIAPFKCAAANEQAVDRMAWLAGCWQGEFGEPGTVEQWLAPAGGTMLGMSRTIKRGKTAQFEFMQLRQLPDGALAFIPQPSGRPATTFKFVSGGAKDALFENALHDFPQRISYALSEPNRLLASIEGERNGRVRKIEFKFNRTSCDSLPSPPPP